MAWENGQYVPGSYQKRAADARRPKGYRLLVQIPDDCSLVEAMGYLARTFGLHKASAAVLVRGHRRPIDWHKFGGAPWHWLKHGWRAYLPIDYKAPRP